MRRYIKVWNLTNCKLRTNLVGHTGYINTVTVSPDGSLCASGGKDGVAMLWDLAEGKRLYSLDAGRAVPSCTLRVQSDHVTKISWKFESPSQARIFGAFGARPSWRC